MRDASKVAFYRLVEWAVQHHFYFIDAQQSTAHLQSLGAEEISRIRFMNLLQEALNFETLKGRWNLNINF
jgi:leucyl/phenylalanyl-tRNA--protein transferase